MGVAGPLQLVSLRKLLGIASFQSRLATAHNPELSAIVRYNLAIILCLFHLETPTQLKSTAPQYLLQLNLGGITCPDGAAAAAAAPPPRSHSLALFTAPPPPTLAPLFFGGQALTFLFCVRVTRLKDGTGSQRCPRPPPPTAALFLSPSSGFCSQVSSFLSFSQLIVPFSNPPSVQASPEARRAPVQTTDSIHKPRAFKLVGGGVLPSSPVNTNQCLCPF